MLLASLTWLRAQEGDPGADIWRAPSGQPTVTGCLEAPSGHYTVIALGGTATRLTGNVAFLSRYVGHEVEITGKPTVITLDTTEEQAASTVEELPALDVHTAKDISKTCRAATSSYDRE